MKKDEVIREVNAIINRLIASHALEEAEAGKIKKDVKDFLSKKDTPRKMAIFLSGRLKGFLRSIGCFEDEIENEIKELYVTVFSFLYEDQIKAAKKRILDKYGNKEKWIVNDLRKADSAFYNICKKRLKGDHGIDTVLVSRIFGMNFEPAYGREFNEVISKVVKQLEIDRPEEINSSWMIDKVRNEYVYLVQELSSEFGVKWDIFIEALPIEWQGRCKFRKCINFNLYIALKVLRIHLEAHDPDYFNVKYLYDRVSDVWSYMQRTHKNPIDDSVNWKLLISHLAERWQCRWRSDNPFVIIPDGAYIFETGIDALEELLSKETAKICSVGTIKKNNVSLYNFFVKRVRGANGNVDWRLIRSCLTKKSQKKLQLPSAKEHSMPEKFYKDRAELERLLYKKDLKLYSLFAAATGENREIANEVCAEVVKLAQVGNLDAYETIFEYLEQITAFWIMNNEDLSVLKYFREDFNKMIRRCIYKYTGTSGPFLAYLYKSATYKAKEMQYVKYKEISLNDRGYRDSSTLNHELISSK